MITKRFLNQFIHESNLIEGIDSKKEDVQSLVAWDYLYDYNMPLTQGVICKVQKIITLNQGDLRPDQRGYYRNLSRTNVTIGGRLAPSWKIIQAIMDNWVFDYDDPN